MNSDDAAGDDVVDSAPTAEHEAAADTAMGIGAAETELLPEAIRSVETPAAWSLDDDAHAGAEVTYFRDRLASAAIPLFLTALVVFILAAAVGGVLWIRQSASKQGTGGTTPVKPVALLDGSYRLDYDYSQATINGSPNPPSADQPQSATVWAAFHSSCTPAGCAATGVTLDEKDHQKVATPRNSSEYRFDGKRWQRAPARQRERDEQCSIEGNEHVPGEDTVVVTVSMEPQPGGTLRGLKTVTVITSECSKEGSVRQFSFAATRVGDAPAGVALPDPAAVPTPNSVPATPSPGPSLEGMYRLLNDGTQDTDSLPAGSRRGSPATEWWALRSWCKPTGCIATKADLDQVNPQEASGGGGVFRFLNDHWQDNAIQVLMACKDVATRPPDPSLQIVTERTWSLWPQPDGALRAVETITVSQEKCGLPRRVIEMRYVATRVGDVPPTVIVADPKLF